MTKTFVRRLLTSMACLHAMTAIALCQDGAKGNRAHLEPPITAVKPPAQAPDPLSFSFNISDDTMAFTVLFANFTVATNEVQSQPLVVSRTETIDLPIANNDKPVKS